MRKHLDETMESWAFRVELFEKERAVKRITNGDNLEKVMKDMSRRIKNKMLCPIFYAIRDSATITYDAAASRKEYEDIMKNVRKSADHIDNDT